MNKVIPIVQNNPVTSPNPLESSNPAFLPFIINHNRLVVNVGGVNIGGAHPVVVQAMTNTDTADITATVAQILALFNAGAQLVRVTVNNKPAARAVGEIINRLAQLNTPVPIVGDFHYNGDQLLRDFPDCAQGLSKYRINPGNAGSGNKKDKAFATFIETAIKYNKPIRIGVNWGSLDSEVLARLMDENAKLANPLPSWQIMRTAIVCSAVESAKLAEKLGLSANKIILSCKVSNVPDMIAVNRALANVCNYPIHLGLTEAGMGDKGVSASAVGLSALLVEGIGNTIRVSLTPNPGESRTREVIVAQEILQSLGLRAFFPSVTACPGCGRTTSVFFQKLAQLIEKHLRDNMPIWKKSKAGVVNMKVAVMGCIVNGPGESKHANIGISLPGTGENPAAPIFVDGLHTTTLRGENIAEQFIKIIDEYVEKKY